LQTTNEQELRATVKELCCCYSELDQRCIDLKNQKINQEDTILRASEKLLNCRIDHAQQVSQLTKKVRACLKIQCEKSIECLKKQLDEATRCENQVVRKNNEAVKESQFNSAQVLARIADLQKQSAEGRARNHEVHTSVASLGMLISQQTQELVYRDYKIDELQRVLTEKQMVLQKVRDLQKEQSNHLVTLHNQSRRINHESFERLHERVCQLETAIRAQE